MVLGEDTSSSEGEAGQPSRKRQKNGTGAEAMQREHVERTEEENEGEGEEMEMEGEEEAVEDPDEDLMADMFMDFGGLPDMEDEEQSISSASSPGTSNEGASEESEGSVPGVPFGAVEELVMEEEEEEQNWSDAMKAEYGSELEDLRWGRKCARSLSKRWPRLQKHGGFEFEGLRRGRKCAGVRL